MNKGTAKMSLAEYDALQEIKRNYIALMDLVSDEVENHRRYMTTAANDASIESFYFKHECEIKISDICKITGWQFDKIDAVNCEDCMRIYQQTKARDEGYQE